ncbi:MAG: EAL domain-containing protein [Thiobacillus sp.]|uniref:putative bifunctional diguanylate cyclase/phosphodiesterase n=1 Tax=Thiobacillus sp. TaxID=924 RepID=UPI002732D7C6|nr:EAL domain-containing protein [Thiobacillus sp.]MDP3584574.1 EAL domain-containing protein [Thiobacillus sp.]
MQPAAPSDSCVAETGQGDPHVDRLNTLWKLSVQRGLSDAERIRAMLEMAADVLDMDLVVLGEFGERYTAHYVSDRLGVFPEGTVKMVETVLCHGVQLSREPSHIADLRAHPLYADHPVVNTLGLRTYSGLPVAVGDDDRWVLAFLRRRCESPPDAVDIAYMELIADWLGNALHQSAQKDLLQRIALTDPLTSLPNRRAAEERLQKEEARTPRDGHGFALALVDLDHFKMVNDRYGHAVGDEVLKTMASRFQSGLREGDWVARWGGEEFLFVLHGSTLEQAADIMQRLADQARAAPVQTSVGAISVSFSAGVAAFGMNDSGVQPMLEQIDHAMYRAKADGRDQVKTVAQPSVPWNSALLRQALAENRVRQASQPIVDLQSGQIIADEALARIGNASGEIVEAKDFVDMAEGLGLMAEIDRQVIRGVMQRCVVRIDQGGAPDFAHFVNVSPQFLARHDLVEEMLENAMSYCQTCSVMLGPVKPIVLELTERQRIVSLDKLRADLQPFIDFGFRLALDDFGSGYSSYLYLAHLPVSFLKIEGWLVSHMRQDRKIAGIVESLANFARKEGMRTVAEHVEDAETARILADMGVDYGQGWHFGRPQLV